MNTIYRTLLILSCLALLAACAPTPPAPSRTTAPPEALPTLTQAARGFLTPTPPPPESSPSSATPTPIPSETSASPTVSARRRAMVVIWDGGGAESVYDLMDDGYLPHFRALVARGVQFASAQPVDPSLSAPSQASLVSGSLPSQTGIVSNAFHNPNDSYYWYRQGFDEPFDSLAEPVWVTASRYGLTSAALFMTGGSTRFPSQAADYTIGYGFRDAYSRQEQVALSPSTSSWEGAPASYSPPLEGFFFIPQVTRVDVLALDTTDDRLPNYDLLLLNPSASSPARQVSPATLALESSEWGALTLLPATQAGADFLLQEISARQATLYHSGVYHNLAAPRALLEALNEKFGFFPAGPDAYALEQGWISADDFLEMLARQARWMAQVSAWVYQEYQPDLLFTWQNGFDAAGHNFLLSDPRQPGYEAQRVEEYAAYRQRTARIADQSLALILNALDLEETTLILTADHGIAPIHSTIYVNRLLQQAGLLKLDRRNYVVVDQSKALAVTSGGAAHIYINLQGRQVDGIVPPEDYLPLQVQIVELLQAQLDPATGQPLFQRVLPYQELGALGLDHPNSGDVFAQAALGYHLDDWRGGKEILEPAGYLGDHGHASELPEMQAFLIAAGGGLEPRAQTLPAVSLLDLAPTLARLLGFPAPTASAGQVIPAFFEQAQGE